MRSGVRSAVRSPECGVRSTECGWVLNRAISHQMTKYESNMNHLRMIVVGGGWWVVRRKE